MAHPLSVRSSGIIIIITIIIGGGGATILPHDRAQLQHNFQTSTRQSSNFGGALATLSGHQIKSCAVYLNNHNLAHHRGPCLTRYGHVARRCWGYLLTHTLSASIPNQDDLNRSDPWLLWPWHMIFPGCENIKIQFNMLPKNFVDSPTFLYAVIWFGGWKAFCL